MTFYWALEIRQLEIEREAIKRENDEEKLKELNIEIGNLSVDRDTLKAKWQEEKEIVEKGAEFYYSIVRGKDDDYLKYVISKRINAFRYGLYPTTKKIILYIIFILD